MGSEARSRTGSGAEKGEEEEEVRPYKELGLYFGGIVVMFFGFILCLTVVGVIFGLPLLIVGYAVYKSSSLAQEADQGVKMDYREKDE